MRSVVAAVLLGTGRIDLIVAMLSEGEEQPQGRGFLGRMSVLGAVDSSEGGVSSETAGRCSQGEDLLGIPCCLSSRVFDEMRHVS